MSSHVFIEIKRILALQLAVVDQEGFWPGQSSSALYLTVLLQLSPTWPTPASRMLEDAAAAHSVMIFFRGEKKKICPEVVTSLLLHGIYSA